MLKAKAIHFPVCQSAAFYSVRRRSRLSVWTLVLVILLERDGSLDEFSIELSTHFSLCSDNNRYFEKELLRSVKTHFNSKKHSYTFGPTIEEWYFWHNRMHKPTIQSILSFFKKYSTKIFRKDFGMGWIVGWIFNRIHPFSTLFGQQSELWKRTVTISQNSFRIEETSLRDETFGSTIEGWYFWHIGCTILQSRV